MGQNRRGPAPYSRRERLEQFDRVSGGVLDEDLSASFALDDVAPKVHSALPQPIDGRRQILDGELEAVPTARLGLATGLACAA